MGPGATLLAFNTVERVLKDDFLQAGVDAPSIVVPAPSDQHVFVRLTRSKGNGALADD